VRRVADVRRWAADASRANRIRTLAALFTPVQVVVGDWAAHFVGEYQPTKLAAMEGLARTQAGAPLSLGGVYVDGELHYAIAVPNALSLLAKWDPNAVVTGSAVNLTARPSGRVTGGEGAL
jgi:cytochrome bd-type quinol oxidase subunit 1